LFEEMKLMKTLGLKCLLSMGLRIKVPPFTWQVLGTCLGRSYTSNQFKWIIYHPECMVKLLNIEKELADSQQ
jgi:hypothetical protein